MASEPSVRELYNQAQAHWARHPLGIRFEVDDATDLVWAADQSFDLVLAVFLFNYLDAAQTRQCMAEVARVLKPGGRFVFGAAPPCVFLYAAANAAVLLPEPASPTEKPQDGHLSRPVRRSGHPV